MFSDLIRGPIFSSYVVEIEIIVSFYKLVLLDLKLLLRKLFLL